MILFPTLISLCYQHDSNLTILRSELNSILLSTFLHNTVESFNLGKNCEFLTQRFPKDLWNKAIEYFG